MLSLELAKKLKFAGLVWEPKRGDYFAAGYETLGNRANIYVVSGEHSLVPELGGKMWFFGGHFCNRDGGCLMDTTASYCMNMNGVKPEGFREFSVSSVRKMLWLPSLSQLLAEIEGRNYQYVIWSGGEVAIAPKGECTCYERCELSLCDSVANCLLWILEREKDENNTIK